MDFLTYYLHFRTFSTGLLQDLSQCVQLCCPLEVPTRLMELAPHELNCCLAGVVSLGCSDHKFFVSVGKSAQARVGWQNVAKDGKGS